VTGISLRCHAPYPTEYLTLNGKLRLYALRDCADQLRRLHGISIHIVNRERLQDIYVVTARAQDKTSCEDESTGAVALGSLKGDALANALMQAGTKAKRRVTLSLAGLGWLDESEISSIPGATVHHSGPSQDHDGVPAGGTVVPEPPAGDIICTMTDPEATRLTADQGRDLKKLAQTAFGYVEGERRLRADLGFEVDERLSLRHLCAHVSVARYAALMTAYEATLRHEADIDVP
jgi:hypothetical protein